MPSSAEHEVAVEAFMAAARLSDPEKHALVCSMYPVKSRFQLDHIRRREIPVGLHPGKYATDVAVTMPQPTAAAALLQEAS